MSDAEEGGTCSFIPQSSVSHETDPEMFPNHDLQFYNDHHFFYLVNSHFKKIGKKMEYFKELGYLWHYK